MANQQQQQISAEGELFLDILTKEEREALLTKKMEEIRKKNEVLRKRHEEIEADKRNAEKMIKPSSPSKEFNPLPGEEQRKATRPPGRGKPVSRGREKPKSQGETRGMMIHSEYKRRSNRIPSTGDDSEIQAQMYYQPSDHRHPAEHLHNFASSRPKIDRSKHRRLNNTPDGENEEMMHADYRRRPLRLTDNDDRNNDIQIQICNEPSEKRQTFVTSRQPRDRPKYRPSSDTTDGPPPDPAYNFLADKRREGPIQDARSKDYRRHPKNYGGSDFKNVKTKIKAAREKPSYYFGPPQSMMEMSLSMTGRERRQYMEWKAERERVDKERIERQKSASGEWRREWDAEKFQQDYEEVSTARHTELGRKPAAEVYTRSLSTGEESQLKKAVRIGSGRFDRGERDDRQRGEAPGPKVNRVEPMKKTMRGGRGGSRGGGRLTRNRTASASSTGSDSRKVERQRDLLVVKIDNSPGKGDDVEVEYSDTEITSAAAVKQPNNQGNNSEKPTTFSSTPNAKNWDADIDDVWEKAGIKHNAQDGTETRDCKTEGHLDDEELMKDDDETFEDDRQTDPSHNHGDTDEWEDCHEDDTFCPKEDEVENEGSALDLKSSNLDANTTSSDSLKMDCQLNPEAPAFFPTSPDFLKTPPGHIKVLNWAAEVAHTDVSKTSSSSSLESMSKQSQEQTCKLESSGADQSVEKIEEFSHESTATDEPVSNKEDKSLNGSIVTKEASSALQTEEESKLDEEECDKPDSETVFLDSKEENIEAETLEISDNIKSQDTVKQETILNESFEAKVITDEGAAIATENVLTPKNSDKPNLDNSILESDLDQNIETSDGHSCCAGNEEQEICQQATAATTAASNLDDMSAQEPPVFQHAEEETKKCLDNEAFLESAPMDSNNGSDDQDVNHDAASSPQASLPKQMAKESRLAEEPEEPKEKACTETLHSFTISSDMLENQKLEKTEIDCEAAGPPTKMESEATAEGSDDHAVPDQ